MLLPVQLPADCDGDEEDESELVVLTGDMDLLGKLHDVAGLTAKIQVGQGDRHRCDHQHRP